jgi:hypothetical protein
MTLFYETPFCTAVLTKHTTVLNAWPCEPVCNLLCYFFKISVDIIVLYMICFIILQLLPFVLSSIVIIIIIIINYEDFALFKLNTKHCTVLLVGAHQRIMPSVETTG